MRKDVDVSMHIPRPYFRIQYQITSSIFIFSAVCLATFAAALFVLSVDTVHKMQKVNLDINCRMRSDGVAQTISQHNNIAHFFALSREVQLILSNSQDSAFVLEQAKKLFEIFNVNQALLLQLFDENLNEITAIQSRYLNPSINSTRLRPLSGLNSWEKNKTKEKFSISKQIVEGPYLEDSALVPGKDAINELISFSLALTKNGLVSLDEQEKQEPTIGFMTIFFSAEAIVRQLESQTSNYPHTYIDSAILCKKQSGMGDLIGMIPETNVSIGQEQAKNISESNPHLSAEFVDASEGEGKLLVSVSQVSTTEDYFVVLYQHSKGYNAMPATLRNLILITVFSIVGGMLLFTFIGASLGSRQIRRLKMATMHEKPLTRQWLIIPWWILPDSACQVSNADCDSEGQVPEYVPFRPHLRDELDDIAQQFNEMNDSLALQYSHLEKRVYQRNEEIERARIAANNANDAKSHFLARVTHELRTPLNGILGTAMLCLGDDDADQIHESLRTIFKCSDLLLHLITDLLSFNQTEDESITLEMREFTVSDIKNQLNAIFTEQCGLKDIQLSFDIEPATQWVVLHGDTNRILQVIFNLMSNGLKFTPQGGKLFFRVRMTPSNSDIRDFTFEIEDTGPGIDAELQRKIFDEFFQGEVGTREKNAHREGAGLGLYICRHLAEKMGGTIQVRSELGRGSLFIFKIPIVATMIAEEQKVCLRPLSLSDPPVNKADMERNTKSPSVQGSLESISNVCSELPSSSLKVLVVDDNKVNQEVMKRMLKMDGIENIEVASDGIEALTKVREHMTDSSFDIVFMDVQMPNMDGYEATRRIRSDLHYEGPIVAVSAFADEANANGCIAAGMNKFLSKPLRRPHLRQILRDIGTEQ